MIGVVNMCKQDIVQEKDTLDFTVPVI